MKFSKKDFEENYNPKEVEELYDPNKGQIDGDTVITQNQISVDTPVIPGDDSSGFIQGISKDTEKHASQTKNQFSDIAMSRFNMGTPYGYVREDEEKLKEDAKEKMKKIVKELLQKRNDYDDLVSDKKFSDINRNSIPDLEEINDIGLNSILDELLNNLTGKEEDVIAATLNELVVKLSASLSVDYKNMIKNNL
jgi:hypothetical protein